MPEVFDPKKKHKLESEFRKKMLPVKPFLDYISGIPEQDRNIALEIGPGTGYFTVVLAKKFNKVYGIEISLEMVEYLSRRIEKESIKNVGLIVANKNEKIPSKLDFKVDLTLFSNVLHEVPSPEEYVKWTDSKYIVVIDWRDMELDFGPKKADKIPEDKAKAMLEQAGYKTRSIDSYKYHYFLVGIRQEKG